MEWTQLLPGVSVVASLISTFVVLKVQVAVSNLQRDIERQRREDADSMRKWAEERFQTRHVYGRSAITD